MSNGYETKINKWGNSLAIRIPQPLLDQIAATESDAILISVENGKLIITKRKYDLQTLLKDITEDNHPDLIEF